MKTRLFALCALCALLLANGPPAPATGVIATAYSVTRQGIELEVRGDLVYFGDWGPGRGTLQVFDVTDLANPVRLGGHLNMGQEVGDLTLVGDQVHVANDQYHYRVVDVSNPYAPYVTAGYSSGAGGYAHCNWYDGGRYAYVGYGWADYVAIFDMSVPGLLRRYHTGHNGIRDVLVEGDRMYLLMGPRFGFPDPAKLRVVDVSDPKFPAELGELDLPKSQYGYCCQIKIQDGYAYLAAANDGWYLGGLRIADIADPTAMSVVGSHDFSTTGAYARGIGLEVVGDRAYVAGSGGLRAYDVADATAPALLARFPMPTDMPTAFGTNVRVRGDIAFMSAYDNYAARGGLVIYRIQVPIAVCCSINLTSNGMSPVVILSTPDFDATTVDPATVRFGPDGAVMTKKRPTLVDFDEDGLLDMKLHFACPDTGIAATDTEVRLSGYTKGGFWFEGTDAINVVKPKRR